MGGLLIEEMSRDKVEKKYPAEKYKIEHRSRKTNIIIISEPDERPDAPTGLALWDDTERSGKEV
jgi:hypothetical protein